MAGNVAQQNERVGSGLNPATGPERPTPTPIKGVLAHRRSSREKPMSHAPPEPAFPRPGIAEPHCSPGDSLWRSRFNVQREARQCCGPGTFSLTYMRRPRPVRYLPRALPVGCALSGSAQVVRLRHLRQCQKRPGGWLHATDGATLVPPPAVRVLRIPQKGYTDLFYEGKHAGPRYDYLPVEVYLVQQPQA